MDSPITTAFWTGELIVAICALVVSLIAVAVAAVTTYFQWLSTAATLIISFSARYESPEIRASRKSLASKLLDPERRFHIDLAQTELVLEFFEEIGYLTRKRVGSGPISDRLATASCRYFAMLGDRGKLD